MQAHALKRYRGLTAVMLALASALAWGGQLAVSAPWVRATAPGQLVSGAYMQIESAVDARLVGVAAPGVGRVEMHEMRMDGDVMRMRELNAIILPKGKTVTLAPGGLHLMILDLKQPIVDGSRLPLVLSVETRGKVARVRVEAIASPSAPSGQHGHAHSHAHTQ